MFEIFSEEHLSLLKKFIAFLYHICRKYNSSLNAETCYKKSKIVTNLGGGWCMTGNFQDSLFFLNSYDLLNIFSLNDIGRLREKVEEKHHKQLEELELLLACQ